MLHRVIIIIMYVLEMAGAAVPCFLCDFLLFLLEPIFLKSCALLV